MRYVSLNYSCLNRIWAPRSPILDQRVVPRMVHVLDVDRLPHRLHPRPLRRLPHHPLLSGRVAWNCGTEETEQIREMDHRTNGLHRDALPPSSPPHFGPW